MRSTRRHAASTPFDLPPLPLPLLTPSASPKKSTPSPLPASTSCKLLYTRMIGCNTNRRINNAGKLVNSTMHRVDQHLLLKCLHLLLSRLFSDDFCRLRLPTRQIARTAGNGSSPYFCRRRERRRADMADQRFRSVVTFCYAPRCGFAAVEVEVDVDIKCKFESKFGTESKHSQRELTRRLRK